MTYRVQAERDEAPIRASRCGEYADVEVGMGTLRRANRAAACPVPGALSRWWYSVQHQDHWCCLACGRVYRWTLSEWEAVT